jgi:hypothetical protein
MNKPKPNQSDDSIVKTTIRLPRTIWHAARVQALDDQIDFQDLVVSALKAYLKKPRRKGGVR